MEWNADFHEPVLVETTPLPVTLQQKDLRFEYSTQTPYRSAALYNVFVMEQTAADVFDQFERVANVAADKCNESYYKVCEKNNVSPIAKVSVIRYQDLLIYATSQFGSEFVDAVKADIYYQYNCDEREKCLTITDRLMIQCQELPPAMVI